MEVVRHPRELAGFRKPAFLAIGVFDGVHIGHQALIEDVVSAARRAGGTSVVVTFHPHPSVVLLPGREPLLLTTFGEKLAVLKAIGVDVVLAFPFTRALARKTARQFVEELLWAGLHPRSISVGYNFTFGRGGQGKPDLLKRMGGELGFEVRVFKPVSFGGLTVSSTVVRRVLGEGRVGLAWNLLGRPYSVTGKVQRGDGLATTLGFPTANVGLPGYKALPLRGVYAVTAKIGSKEFSGVANLGRRPTFGGNEDRLEVHLLDFDASIYGEELEVAFIRWIRSERGFSGPEALEIQIRQDVKEARRALAARVKGNRVL